MWVAGRVGGNEGPDILGCGKARLDCGGCDVGWNGGI